MRKFLIIYSVVAILLGAGLVLTRPSIKLGQTLDVPQTLSSNSSLVEHLSFDGPKVSGTTITADTGNNGTLTSGATLYKGVIGQGAYCDGVNDNIAVTVATSSNDSYSF